MKKIIFRILRVAFSPFYDSKYLTGRWFDGTPHYNGWIWAFKGLCNKNKVPFPTSRMMRTGKDISFHPDDLHNFQQMGCYFQTGNGGHIMMGKGTQIAPNVGLITANHDLNDLTKHLPARNIMIGEKCWIGMNSVILPGVTLGDRTIVGAGSIVTKSFIGGNCIIAGNPAEFIRGI